MFDPFNWHSIMASTAHYDPSPRLTGVKRFFVVVPWRCALVSFGCRVFTCRPEVWRSSSERRTAFHVASSGVATRHVPETLDGQIPNRPSRTGALHSVRNASESVAQCCVLCGFQATQVSIHRCAKTALYCRRASLSPSRRCVAKCTP